MSIEFWVLIVPAFIAGVLTFLAPCTLPLVPAYLGFISGISAGELQDKKRASKIRWKIFLNGLAFMIGVSSIFIFFGTLAGFFGEILLPWKIWLARIGGVFVILFGFFMLGILRIPFLNTLLSREKRLRLPFLKRGNPFSSVLLGGAFAFGWTPCVGPILGTILLLASTSATALKGGLLLFVFSLGLAVPFLLVALGAGIATTLISRAAKYLRFVEVVGGIFLIFLGILLLTNKMGLLVVQGYKLFRFLNYERLLDYL